MTLPFISGEMRLGADPELRFTPSGQAVANFRLGSNGRKFNKQTQEWEDSGECWLNAAVWGEYAENVAETLERGMLVHVTGRLETRTYETSEGEKRLSVDLRVDSIGPSLRYATAKVSKTQRREQSGQQDQRPNEPAEDPWNPPANDEPPF
jgi:single-strand DNA-binding protein